MKPMKTTSGAGTLRLQLTRRGQANGADVGLKASANGTVTSNVGMMKALAGIFPERQSPERSFPRHSMILRVSATEPNVYGEGTNVSIHTDLNVLLNSNGEPLVLRFFQIRLAG